MIFAGLTPIKIKKIFACYEKCHICNVAKKFYERFSKILIISKVIRRLAQKMYKHVVKKLSFIKRNVALNAEKIHIYVSIVWVL